MIGSGGDEPFPRSPTEYPLDATGPLVNGLPCKLLVDHPALDSFQLRRAEVLGGSAAVQPLERERRPAQITHFARRLIVLDVVGLRPFEVCENEVVDRRRSGVDRSLSPPGTWFPLADHSAIRPGEHFVALGRVMRAKVMILAAEG